MKFNVKVSWPLFLLFLGVLGCKEQPYEIFKNIDENGILREEYSRRKADFAKEGIYKAFFENGKIKEESEYKDDVLNGYRKLFREEGDLQIEETHKKGLFHGTYKSYYPNGQLESQGEYLENVMTGLWKYYYDTGQIKEEVNFANNNENGPFKEYHPNGKIKTEGSYLNGDSEHGELKKYDENGELYQKMNCEKGVCRTTWTRDAKK